MDDVFIDVAELIQMLNEAEKDHLPILFLFSSRNSDWANGLSNYNKSVIHPVDCFISMMDSFSADEAQNFVDKLICTNIISASTKYEKMDM